MPPKQSEAKPAEKLLALYTLLLFNGGRQFSLKELARRPDCSKQAVLRLVDQLETAEYGKIVYAKLGREAFYSIERPRRLPQISLTAEGIYQLALCRNLILHLLPQYLRRQTEKTLRETAAFADEEVSPDNIVTSRAYTKGSIDYSPFQAQLKIFMRALHHRQVCRVVYQKSLCAEPRGFCFAPKRLIAYHETFFLLGWEVTDKGLPRAKYDNPLSLYLHRCREVEIEQRRAEHLPLPDSRQNEDDADLFGIMRGEPFIVRASFSAEAATYVHERRWSRNQTAQVHEDGSVTLEFEAQSEPEVISRLQGFGIRATVEEPAWLRKEIGAQAAELAEKYR
ncbi:MAG: WYL domain-containing protein [Desulfovibrio sp.]|jgi:predicted DNA-binding transcriptional regulator YafY|nr:WYL domain-containing protein [Desulfovibrio sp.]